MSCRGACSPAIDWLAAVARPGEDYAFQAFHDSVDTLVMGRKTYETALGFDAWPYAGKRCVIVTSDTGRSSRHGEEFFGGELAVLFERLGAEGSKHVYVDGGVVIAQALRRGWSTSSRSPSYRSSSGEAGRSRPSSRRTCAST